MDTQGGAFWDEVLKYIFSRVTNYCQCLEIVLSVELDLMVMNFPSNHTRDSTDEVHSIVTMVSINAANPRVTTILVDLGGVFMHPQLESKLATRESAISLRRIMSTAVWMDYEAGQLSDRECFDQLAKEYHFQASDLAQIIKSFRDTICYDQATASIFKEIKQSGTRIFLVSNISKEDYAALRHRWDDEFWSIFDRVFTSSDLGVRKPSLRFYRQVLRATRALPHETFFLDDRPENVLAALSVGMRGTFNMSELYRTLNNLVGDPVQRGLGFLRRQRGHFPTTTQHGEPIAENYAPLLILEALKDQYASFLS
ncbi:unnamed protein product [Aspergillus oryzae var. brunneus]|uniref:Unnamed protein product n=4 Tax=Aspergillus oryzae TaxID=5062 RepID=A0AAN4YQL6_ASPOZ|nr:unnamed protein product [Aspergillus oryzae]GMG50508.1 unnamed protein product [Aspergillus oryzae var. brunneus]